MMKFPSNDPAEQANWTRLGFSNGLPDSMAENVRKVREVLEGAKWEDGAQQLAELSGQRMGGHRLPHIHKEPPPRPEAERETFGRK